MYPNRCLWCLKMQTKIVVRSLSINVNSSLQLKCLFLTSYLCVLCATQPTARQLDSFWNSTVSKHIWQIIVYLTLVPLGGVGNLRLIDPTFTTLTATWEAADGNVQGYKVVYMPTNGGTELMVGITSYFKVCFYSVDVISGNLSKI